MVSRFYASIVSLKRGGEAPTPGSPAVKTTITSSWSSPCCHMQCTQRPVYTYSTGTLFRRPLALLTLRHIRDIQVTAYLNLHAFLDPQFSATVIPGRHRHLPEQASHRPTTCSRGRRCLGRRLAEVVVAEGVDD